MKGTCRMKKHIRIIMAALLIVSMLVPLVSRAGALETGEKVSAGLVQTSSELPVVSIWSDEDLNSTIYQSKDAKVDATAEITGAEDKAHNLAESAIELKTRGNTTWGVAKWAYQIKFDTKVDLFDMGKAKKWILLANYYDGTFVRNKVIFDLGKEIGIPYVVESVFVELYINGEYRGVYQLAEKVELGSSRIDIGSDYGVLLEMDAINRPAELAAEIYFQTETTGKPFVYKEYNTDFEDEAEAGKVAEVRAFTENFINALEAELYSDDADWATIESMIDVDSFIRYYFITEFSMEVDATYSSTFFYLDGPGDVLHCGPLWDYDRIMGWDTSYDQTVNNDYLKNITDSTDEYRVEWFKMLFRHPEFVERVNEFYDEVIRYAFDTDKVISMFCDYQELLMPALVKNHEKYIVFHNRSYTVEELMSGTAEEKIAYTTNALTEWLTYRNEYLETAYGKYHPTLMYQTHDEFSGWQAAYSGGSMTYLSENLTGVSMTLENNDFDGSIEYAVSKRTDISDYMSAGETARISESDRINGLYVRLTGNLAEHFSVEYRVQRNGTWSAWKRDGERAGSSSGAYIERIQVRLVQIKDVEAATVSFASSIGTAPAYVTTIAGNSISLDAVIEAEGYVFGGWYDNAGFEGEALTSFVAPAGETTLYAKMEEDVSIGDIDANDRITMLDLFRLKLFIKQSAVPTERERKAADVDGSGTINMLDSFELKYRISTGEWRDK